MGNEEKVLVEVKYIREKVDGIDDILRGKDGKPGLIAMVDSHEEYIEDQKAIKRQKGFDTYRAVMAGLVTLLVGLVVWNTNMLKTSLKEEIRKQIESK